jgi:hypothetical protein
MIYIFFLLVNFLAMGLGVWLAIRQKEQSLRAVKTNNLQMTAEMSEPTEEMISLTPKSAQKIKTRQYQPKKESDKSFEEPEIITQDNSEILTEHAVENSELPDHFIMSRLSATESATDFVEEKPETSFVEPMRKTEPNEYEITSESEILPTSTAMIENVVEMIQKSDASDEFSEIASRLQEIHDLMATPDKQYYVSEDAQSFVTPKESSFVSTIFCRPIVGRKK